MAVHPACHSRARGIHPLKQVIPAEKKVATTFLNHDSTIWLPKAIPTAADSFVWPPRGCSVKALEADKGSGMNENQASTLGSER